jgi:hypothetical protein
MILFLLFIIIFSISLRRITFFSSKTETTLTHSKFYIEHLMIFNQVMLCFKTFNDDDFFLIFIFSILSAEKSNSETKCYKTTIVESKSRHK